MKSTTEIVEWAAMAVFFCLVHSTSAANRDPQIPPHLLAIKDFSWRELKDNDDRPKAGCLDYCLIRVNTEKVFSDPMKRGPSVKAGIPESKCFFDHWEGCPKKHSDAMFNKVTAHQIRMEVECSK